MTAVASCKLQVTSHKSQVTSHKSQVTSHKSQKRRPVGRLVGCVPAVLIRPTENHRSLKEWLLVSCLLSLIFQPPTCTAHLYPLSFILYPFSFFLYLALSFQLNSSPTPIRSYCSRSTSRLASVSGCLCSQPRGNFRI